MFQAMVVETATGDPIGKWAWKPLAFVLGANLAFGVLLGGLPSIGLPAMGMIIAIYALTIISSMAGEHFKLRDVLVLSTILAAAGLRARRQPRIRHPAGRPAEHRPARHGHDRRDLRAHHHLEHGR